MNLDETHDPGLKSWVESANATDADFPIQNLPFCFYRHGDGPPRIGVGIGDQIFYAAKYTTLTELMTLGRDVLSQLRLRISRTLRAGHPHPPRHLLHPLAECTLLPPTEIRDYTDFYASIYHATNVGSMF